ncbi:hypothetical protein LNM27_002526 [Enterococcus faecalis]|nr:hypothetical protein [Enterococcus faecalis]
MFKRTGKRSNNEETQFTIMIMNDTDVVIGTLEVGADIDSETFWDTDKSSLFTLKYRQYGCDFICMTSIKNLEERYQIVVYKDVHDSEQRVYYRTDKRSNKEEQHSNDSDNLLEIKLKDINSVPEVHYKGVQVDGMPKGLVDIYFYWRTENSNDAGEANVRVKYLDDLEEITCIHNKFTDA